MGWLVRYVAARSHGDIYVNGALVGTVSVDRAAKISFSRVGTHVEIRWPDYPRKTAQTDDAAETGNKRDAVR